MSAPAWAWWGRPAGDADLRYAVRVIGQGARIEEIVCEGGPPLDRALQAHQRAHPSMGRNDRFLLGAAAYGLARNREALRRALPDASAGQTHLLLLALLDAIGAPPAAVPGLPGGAAPWATGQDRLATLRAAWAETLQEVWETELAHVGPRVFRAFSGLFSVPAWWLEAGPWRQVGEAVLELARLKRPQHLTLRVQVHRSEREPVLAELLRLDFPARATDRSPWGILVEGRHNLLATALYRQGTVEVQDEGSQLVACLCNPRPWDAILDLCAGGGGKTLALASLLRNGGRVVAHDSDGRRLSDTGRRARRARLGNIRLAPEPQEAARLGPYDLVLVDAPCTSSGTLRRNPDASWRWDPQALERLVEVQRTILGRAADLVAPDGLLVYATCSLLPSENERQVERFLAANPGFEPAPPAEGGLHAAFRDVPRAPTGAFRLPANLTRYEGDAFFLARLRKRG